MLSEFSSEKIDAALSRVDDALAGHPSAQAALRRVGQTKSLTPDLKVDLYANHALAMQVGKDLSIPMIDARPEDGFSWNGTAVATQTETAVLLHEFAHWQVAPESRRCLPDFGLGAGPETGRVAQAEAACCVDDQTKIREEDLASLLGILWEAEIGGPAIIAFCEQNWLELAQRPGTAAHFVSVLDDLEVRKLINAGGFPVRRRGSIQ